MRKRSLETFNEIATWNELETPKKSISFNSSTIYTLRGLNLAGIKFRGSLHLLNLTASRGFNFADRQTIAKYFVNFAYGTCPIFFANFADQKGCISSCRFQNKENKGPNPGS